MQNREHRFPSNMAVRIYLDNEAYRAHVANVSAGGARLIGAEQLPVGAQLTIQCRHLCIRARVAWSRDVETGVEFLMPLGPEDRRTLMSAASSGWATP